MACRSSARLRVVGEPELRQSPSATFIGPDYARIMSRDWGRLHAIADRRDPLDFNPGSGRWMGTDNRRFER